MPQQHTGESVAGFLRPRELRPTDHVVVVSNASRRDFETAFRHPAERVHVVLNGIDHALFFPKGPAAEGPPYIASVGMIEPRKNLVLGLAAFEELAKEHATLRWKVAGRRGWGAEAFDEAVLKSPARGRVDLVGALPDAALADLYRGAACLFFPSVWEGFGIPVVEAMACGTPVAASQVPAVREVAGGAAELFDPEDVRAMAEALRKAGLDSGGRQARCARGRARAADFSWDKSAQGHLEVYARALGCEAADLAPRGGRGP
jgi:alpha-1,3-rhamnosyl/mannosyltransferase